MDDHDGEKRREQNLFVHSGKSEAVLTKTEDCARRTVLLKLTTDSDEASRGFSTIAGLLVLT